MAGTVKSLQSFILLHIVVGCSCPLPLNESWASMIKGFWSATHWSPMLRLLTINNCFNSCIITGALISDTLPYLRHLQNSNYRMQMEIVLQQLLMDRQF